MYIDFRLMEMNFFQSEKTSVQVTVVPKLTVSFNGSIQ